MRITAKELLELGLWERYCRETGTSEWCINEGKLDSNEVLEWNLTSPLT